MDFNTITIRVISSIYSSYFFYFSTSNVLMINSIKIHLGIRARISNIKEDTIKKVLYKISVIERLLHFCISKFSRKEKKKAFLSNYKLASDVLILPARESTSMYILRRQCAREVGISRVDKREKDFRGEIPWA